MPFPAQIIPFVILCALLILVGRNASYRLLVIGIIVGTLTSVIEFILVINKPNLSLSMYLLFFTPMFGAEHILRTFAGQSTAFFSLSTIPYYPLFFHAIHKKQYWLLFLLLIPLVINVGLLAILFMYAGLDA